MPVFPRTALKPLLAACALSAMLAGCASVAVPKLPTGDLPVRWRNAPAQGSAHADLGGWWKHFDDPQLDALVDAALRDNLDVRQAALALRAARLLEGTATAANHPQLGFDTLPQSNAANTHNYFRAGFDASWEPGLFGRAEANRRIARADSDSAAVALQAARVALVAEVVREYLQLRAAQRGAALLDAAAQATAEKLALMQVREHLQLASQLEVANLASAAGKARALAAEPRAAIAQHAQALAILLGRSEPDPAWLAARSLPILKDDRIDTLPADLLRTRPDIRDAEAKVLKAAGELGLAKADLYPRLALGASLGAAAPVSGHAQLGSAASGFGIGPIIDIPLFDWGQRRTQRDARDVQLQASLLAYRQAVLQGAAEVETDLAALHAASQRAQNAAQATDAARNGETLAAKLRSLGEADALQVADAQLALSDSELDLTHARLAHALAYVALFKALGGAPLPAAASGAKATQ